MATFQVPQFIEEKAKIIGPFTLAQFLYIATAAALSFAAFYLFSFFLWLMITTIAGGVAASFAFVKINGEGLPTIIKSAIFFWQKPKKYVWKRELVTETLDVSALEKIETVRRGMGLQEKIKSTALGIATGMVPLFKGAKKTKPKERYQVITSLTGERRVAKRVDYL